MKKKRELLNEEEIYLDMNYEAELQMKKNQIRQIEQKMQREIFIPDVISVSNLAKMIGVHLGKQLTCY